MRLVRAQDRPDSWLRAVDVAATEAMLASLLPTATRAHEYERSHYVADNDDD